MIRALIFDFDGLILDTEVPEFQTWREIYQTYDCELSPSAWAGWVGGTGATDFNPYDHLETLLGRPLDRETLRERSEKRSAELVAAQSILPGVEDCISDARRLGLRLAIASSSDRRWVHGHLKRLGLFDQFDAIKTADDVERTKPDPALFRLALEALGVGPHEAIVFEDSPNGVLAANRSGVFTVAVPNDVTRPLPLDHADLRLDSLADMRLEALLRIAQSNGR